LVLKPLDPLAELSVPKSLADDIAKATKSNRLSPPIRKYLLANLSTIEQLLVSPPATDSPLVGNNLTRLHLTVANATFFERCKLPQLRELRLKGAGCNIPSLSFLASIPRLERLRLEG